MRVIYNGNRVEFTTGYRIDDNKCDNNLQKVKNGCTNKLKQSSAQINTDLLRYSTDIQEIFKEFEVKNIIPTSEQLKTAFNKRYESIESLGQKTPKFYDIFDEFTNECGIQNNWTIATYKKFKTVKNHLYDFDSELTLESLDEIKLTEYVNFLRDIKSLRNSTIVKQIGFLKWFLRWSIKKGYTNNNAYSTFKPKLKNTQKKVIFLIWDELTKLREYKIPNHKQYLERVRDIFLFCCFTGLRYSDVYNLKRSDVKDNHIEITTEKTADSLIIELNNHSRTILDKYKDVMFEKGKVLPVISNQKMNEYLKELAELAEINELVRQTYYIGNKRIDEVVPK
jgi:integrase